MPFRPEYIHHCNTAPYMRQNSGYSEQITLSLRIISGTIESHSECGLKSPKHQPASTDHQALDHWTREKLGRNNID